MADFTFTSATPRSQTTPASNDRYFAPLNPATWSGINGRYELDLSPNTNGAPGTGGVDTLIWRLDDPFLGNTTEFSKPFVFPQWLTTANPDDTVDITLRWEDARTHPGLPAGTPIEFVVKNYRLNEDKTEFHVVQKGITTAILEFSLTKLSNNSQAIMATESFILDSNNLFNDNNLKTFIITKGDSSALAAFESDFTTILDSEASKFVNSYLKSLEVELEFTQSAFDTAAQNSILLSLPKSRGGIPDIEYNVYIDPRSTGSVDLTVLGSGARNWWDSVEYDTDYGVITNTTVGAFAPGPGSTGVLLTGGFTESGVWSASVSRTDINNVGQTDKFQGFDSFTLTAGDDTVRIGFNNTASSGNDWSRSFGNLELLGGNDLVQVRLSDSVDSPNYLQLQYNDYNSLGARGIVANFSGDDLDLSSRGRGVLESNVPAGVAGPRLITGSISDPFGGTDRVEFHADNAFPVYNSGRSLMLALEGSQARDVFHYAADGLGVINTFQNNASAGIDLVRLNYLSTELATYRVRDLANSSNAIGELVSGARFFVQDKLELEFEKIPESTTTLNIKLFQVTTAGVRTLLDSSVVSSSDSVVSFDRKAGLYDAFSLFFAAGVGSIPLQDNAPKVFALDKPLLPNSNYEHWGFTHFIGASEPGLLNNISGAALETRYEGFQRDSDVDSVSYFNGIVDKRGRGFDRTVEDPMLAMVGRRQFSLTDGNDYIEQTGRIKSVHLQIDGGRGEDKFYYLARTDDANRHVTFNLGEQYNSNIGDGRRDVVDIDLSRISAADNSSQFLYIRGVDANDQVRFINLDTTKFRLEGRVDGGAPIDVPVAGTLSTQKSMQFKVFSVNEPTTAEAVLNVQISNTASDWNSNLWSASAPPIPPPNPAAPAMTLTYAVTVSSYGANNVYQFNGQDSPPVNLTRGGVYTFDQSAASNVNHQIVFKDGAGNPYLTGVVSTGTPGNVGAQTVFTVPNDAPGALRYYCVLHGDAMGNTINTLHATLPFDQAALNPFDYVSNARTAFGTFTPISMTNGNDEALVLENNQPLGGPLRFLGGDDYVIAGGGDADIALGAGNDFISIRNTGQQMFISGGPGHDVIGLAGGVVTDVNGSLVATDWSFGSISVAAAQELLRAKYPLAFTTTADIFEWDNGQLDRVTVATNRLDGTTLYLQAEEFSFQSGDRAAVGAFLPPIEESYDFRLNLAQIVNTDPRRVTAIQNVFGRRGTDDTLTLNVNNVDEALKYVGTWLDATTTVLTGTSGVLGGSHTLVIKAETAVTKWFSTGRNYLSAQFNLVDIENIRLIDDNGSDVTIRVAGSNGFGSVAEAVSKASRGDVIFVAEHQENGVAAANGSRTAINMDKSVVIDAGLRVVFEEGANRTVNRLSVNEAFTVRLTESVKTGAVNAAGDLFEKHSGTRLLEVLGSANANIIGSSLNDFIIGNKGNNTIEGRGGDDFLFGGYGSDILLGQSGNDILVGGSSARVHGISHTPDEGPLLLSGSQFRQLTLITGVIVADAIYNSDHIFRTGDKLAYSFNEGTAATISTNNGVSSTPLTSSTALFAIVTPGVPGLFQLATSLADAQAGKSVLITSVGTAKTQALTLDLGINTAAQLAGNDYVVGGSGNDILVAVGVTGSLSSGIVKDTLTLVGGSGDDRFDLFATTGQVNIIGGSGRDTFVATKGFSETMSLNGVARVFDFAATQDSVHGDVGALAQGFSLLGELERDGLRLSQLVSPPLPLVDGEGEDGNYQEEKSSPGSTHEASYSFDGVTINLQDVLNMHQAHAA